MLNRSQCATQIATGLQTELVLMLLTKRKGFKTLVSMSAGLIRRLTIRHDVR